MRLIASAFSFFAAVFAGGCGVASAGLAIPEIARDLPVNFAEGEQVFDARLKARFPVGTMELAVIQELERQRFLDHQGGKRFVRDVHREAACCLNRLACRLGGRERRHLEDMGHMRRAGSVRQVPTLSGYAAPG